ncbi:class F sortase [Kutzneria albida]|nr:class F sortase [Kutzneria albida]
MGRHSARRTRWPESAGGFPLAPRSRYRTPAAAAGTAISGALGLTMIVAAAGATLIAQGQQVRGTAMAASAASTATPQPQNAPAQAPPGSATPPPITGPPQQPQQPAQPVQPRANSVLLPKGGLAELVRSSVGGDGTLQVPNGVSKAALWGADLAAKSGATLIAGHINWEGTVGPFAELWGANQGQTVTVLDASGKPLRFTVSEVLTVNKDNLPQHAQQLFGQDGPHRLVLVTCGGQWVGGALGYDQNRVVIATPAS